MNVFFKRVIEFFIYRTLIACFFFFLIIYILSCSSNKNNVNNFLGTWINNGESRGEVFKGSTVTISMSGQQIIIVLNSEGEKLQNTGTFANGKIHVSLSFAGETDISYSVENKQPHIYIYGVKMDKVGTSEKNSRSIDRNNKTIKEEVQDEKISLPKLVRIGEIEIMSEDLPKLNWREAIESCNNLGNDWRLPTVEELNILYQNRTTIGGFTTGGYWSSSDVVGETWNSNGRQVHDPSQAQYIYFGNGMKWGMSKKETLRTRPVRSVK